MFVGGCVLQRVWVCLCVCIVVFQGEMSASPQCFSVLTHMLMGLAQGRVVLALEVTTHSHL